MYADKPLAKAPPLFDCTVDPATRVSHVSIHMPAPEAMCDAYIDACITCSAPFCTLMFWALVRGMYWALLAIGCFMLLAGVPMLATNVNVPVLYLVLALLVLSLVLSLAFRLSELTSSVDPHSDTRQCDLACEFVGRTCVTVFSLLFVGVMVMTVVAFVMLFLGY